MKWLELSVGAPPEYVEPLSQLFHRYGDGGVAVEMQGGHRPDEGERPPEAGRVRVSTYILRDSMAQERRNRIDVGVRLVAHLASISPLTEREVEQEDWENAWKEHFNVLHVGKRVVIKPTWREFEAAPTDVIVELDPGMAFGTGHHPTTKMCIEMLEERLRTGDRVLDVGCGSGILAIAAVKLGASGVVGLEVDPEAAGVARVNIRHNGVAETARVLDGTLPHSQVPSQVFDLVVVNISARVILSMAPHLVAATRPGGALIASGMLEDRGAEVANALVTHGAEIERRMVEEDWVTVLAQAPNSEREQGSVPTHDSVAPRGS